MTPANRKLIKQLVVVLDDMAAGRTRKYLLGVIGFAKASRRWHRQDRREAAKGGA